MPRRLREQRQIRTTPQRERSDTPTVPRELRERSQNSHRATTRAIRHAQTHKTAGQAHVIYFHKTLRLQRKMSIVPVKNDVLPCSTYVSGSFLLWGLRSTAPAASNEPEESEVLHLPRGIVIMFAIKHDDSFTKQDFDPLPQVQHIAPRKMTSKTSLILIHTCQRFSNVPKVPRLPHGWKTPGVLHLQRKKNKTFGREVSGQPFRARFPSKTEDGQGWEHLGWTPGPNNYGKNPKCGYTVWWKHQIMATASAHQRNSGQIYHFTNLENTIRLYWDDPPKI